MNQLRKGFTLIEILVTITIISILAAVLYANFTEARIDARNKAFQAEMKELQLAIELYQSQNRAYPPVPSGTLPGGCVTLSVDGADVADAAACGAFGYMDGMVPDFTAALLDIADSANENCNILYAVDETAQAWYKLTATNCVAGADTQIEGVQDINELARCPTSCGVNCTVSNIATTTTDFYEAYAIYSAGGECY